MHESSNFLSLLQELKNILEKNKDKRISVVGTTCTGKSYFLKDIPYGIEMSKLAPPLSPEEEKFYYTAPLTRANNEKMKAVRAKRAVVKAGQPVFGTAIAEGTELVIHLKISDGLLKKRTESRGVDFEYAKTMQKFIEEDIEESKLPVIEIAVG